jgi:hypothetical protein
MGDILIYVHPSNGNWKAWGFDAYRDNSDLSKNRVIYFYGSLGKPISKLTQLEKIGRSAHTDAIDKWREKVGDGYYPIPRHIYDSLAYGEISLVHFFKFYAGVVRQIDGVNGYGISTRLETRRWFLPEKDNPNRIYEIPDLPKAGEYVPD